MISKSKIILTVLSAIIIMSHTEIFSAGIFDEKSTDQEEKLLNLANMYQELGKIDQAIQTYKKIIDGFPESVYRYKAYLKMGEFYIKMGKAKEGINVLYQALGEKEDNEEAPKMLFAIGQAYYETKDYQKCNVVMRDLIAKYPENLLVNKAYFLIGSGHFEMKRYKQALEAFNMVGTAGTSEAGATKKFTPFSILFPKVEDPDLNVTAGEKKTFVKVATSSGDEEVVKLIPTGLNSPVFMGSLDSILGDVAKDNGTLELNGKDEIKCSYTDAHAKKDKNVAREDKLLVASDAKIEITDDKFYQKLKLFVSAGTLNIKVTDYDQDVTKDLDEIPIRITASSGDMEAVKAKEKGNHVGLFTVSIPIKSGADVVIGDKNIQIGVGDTVIVGYEDKNNVTPGEPTTRQDSAVSIPGTQGKLEAPDKRFPDEDLEIQTHLKLAQSYTNLGKAYNELGLKDKADENFMQAIKECNTVSKMAKTSKLKEEILYMTWKIYYEMGDYQRALSACFQLINQYPNSEYVGDALFTSGESMEKQKEYGVAIGYYKKLIESLPRNLLVPDAHFRIAECYDEMGGANKAYKMEALKEYTKIAQNFPLSAYAPKAKLKIGNYYFETADYKKASETYESIARDYPDAKFLDEVYLLNGVSYYKMGDKSKAIQMFEEVVTNYPESPNAEKAKKYLTLLKKSASSGDSSE